MRAQPKISEYDQQAIDFLESTDTTFEIVYLYTAPYFDSDKESRDIYQFTLKNAKGEYSHKFGDSIINTLARRAKGNNWLTAQELKQAGYHPKVNADIGGMTRKLARKWEKPSAYSILACLQKYDLGTFEDFCSEFGYNDQPLNKYPDVLKTYQDCVSEYRAISRMFTPEQIEQLVEIN